MDSAKKLGGNLPAFKNLGEKENPPLRAFTSGEEIIHSLMHGATAALAILATVMLAIRATPLGNLHTLGAILFGISLIILYSASATYHATCAVYPPNVESRIRSFAQKLDHCSIFILIVGTYIPACFTSLGGFVGWAVFSVVGSCCAFGFVLNAISVERFQGVSLWIYIITGWTIVIASAALYSAIGRDGFSYLVLGGIFYTVGVIFYRLQNVKYMHIVWHALVILGSVMHYITVYFYCY